MAKNKKRKHRTPIAPPVHSAPGTTPGPARPSPAAPPPGPQGAGAPGGVESVSRPAPKPRKTTQSSIAAARKRRSRRRTYLVVGSVVLLLAAAIVVPRILSNRAIGNLEALAKDAGCGELETTGESGGGDHLSPGETTKYDPLPPSHGPHAGTTLAAGVYDEPLSDDPDEELNIFKAVHSLEHGAVIIWHDKLKGDDLDEVASAYRDEEKILVVPYPELSGKDHMAMTAWGRSLTCEQASTDVADEFIDLFRSARTAPEPNNPI